MTIFSDLELPAGNATKHHFLVDYLVRRIKSGALAPGTQLPPVRQAAWALGCYPGTVARAYAALRTKGLIHAEVGRGTFIGAARTGRMSSLPIDPPDDGLIDMTLNSFTMLPPTAELAAAFHRVADLVSATPKLSGYTAAAGDRESREAGLSWISRWIDNLTPREIAIVSGGQSGLHAAISSLVTPGSGVACEQLTYPGTIAACAQLGVSLTGIAMDDQGLVPEALDEACRRHPISMLIVSTSVNNPTGAVMPVRRREEIAELTTKHDLTVIEDEVYGFLGDPTDPLLSNLLPERAVFLCTLSKIVAPALRVGYMAGSETLIRRIELAHKNTQMMTSPYLAAVASDLIRHGVMERRIAEMQNIVAERRKIAEKTLARFNIVAAISGLVWMPVSDAWRSWEFCQEAERFGVKISPGDIFAVEPGRTAPAVRISLTSEPYPDRLRVGLEVIADLAARPHPTLGATA
ncbi:MAG: PLP-dependent aminotransferase family protein [Fimbriimonadaceae bacterium]|nr:PLP-dependent aminotransferase family protein [Alphaproteobacteria bacterium]